VDACGISHDTYVRIEILNCLVHNENVSRTRVSDCRPQGLPDCLSLEGFATLRFGAKRLGLEAGSKSYCGDLVLNLLWRIAIDLFLHFFSDSLCFL